MTVRILLGDCRERLRDMPADSVHCVVTSPPYFGLRDYGTGKWEGGDPDCRHRIGTQVNDNKASGRFESGVRPGQATSHCRLCGALRIDQQIGLEPTPDEFCAALVEVFREVRRVLRPDGTVWLNLGDSYTAVNRGENAQPRKATERTPAMQSRHYHADLPQTREMIEGIRSSGLKNKDLIGIPWMVAFALRADGWYLRQEIIWSKPSPMPESVRDRCTKAHEHIFLLSRSKSYYYDADAIAEPVSDDEVTAARRDRADKGLVGHGAMHGEPLGQSGRPMKNSGNKRRKTPAERGCPEGTGLNVAGTFPWEGTTRNKRSVWTVGTQPFDMEMCRGCRRIYDATSYRRLARISHDDKPDEVICECGSKTDWLSHFATFPPALIEPCIMAGSAAESCSNCGAPWERQIERKVELTGGSGRAGKQPAGMNAKSQQSHSGNYDIRMGPQVTKRTLGFEPTCECGAEPKPSVVLDPFGGAGTTGMVAERLGRESILIELNADYADLARHRIRIDLGRVDSEAAEPAQMPGPLFA